MKGNETKKNKNKSKMQIFMQQKEKLRLSERNNKFLICNMCVS